jgi:hypothetical protein
MVIEARAYIATPEGQADIQFKANYTKWFREVSGSRATSSLRKIDQERGTSYAEKYGSHPTIDRAPEASAWTPPDPE